MNKFIIFSSILKKVAIAITGLSLFLFLIVHLAGNITIFSGIPPGQDFNAYAHFLESFGILFTVAELGLLAFFLLHITSALYTNYQNYSLEIIDMQFLILQVGIVKKLMHQPQWSLLELF